MSAGRAAVFLDRDGVLNEVVGPAPGRAPWSLAELVVVEGAVEAAALLRRAGFVLVAVTNQPDVARGLVTLAAVEEVDAALAAELGLDEVVVCPHDGHTCRCRKPAPGMVVDTARRLGIDLAASWLVGDRWVDIAAGRAAGVRTVLVEQPTSWAPTSAGLPPGDLVADHCVADVLTAARAIVASDRQQPR